MTTRSLCWCICRESLKLKGEQVLNAHYSTILADFAIVKAWKYD